MRANVPNERILILAPAGGDAAALDESLRVHGLETRVCRSPGECTRQVVSGAGVLLLTEEALELPGISGLLRALKAQPPWSELPLIILNSGGESRRGKLLELAATAAGAVTLLERPMSAATLWRSVHVALRSRRRQFLVRDLIIEQQRKQRELEQAEETLRAARDFHEAVVGNVGEGLYTVDARGRVTAMNSAAEKLLGWTFAELRGRNMHQATHYRHRDGSPFPAKDCAGLQVLRKGRTLTGHEDVFIRKNGEFFDVVYSSSPIREKGKITGLVVVFRDVTELKRSVEIKGRLAAIVEYSEDAVVGKDLNGVITSWNRGAERLFGYAAAEAIGRPITMLIPPDRLDEEPRVLARIRRGESVEHYETLRRRKDGSLVDISLTVSPVRDEYGRIIGASKIARDISDRKQSESLSSRRALQQEQLFNLADVLNRPVEFEVIFQTALDVIQKCLGVPRAAVLLLDDSGKMVFRASRGLSETYRREMEGHSPWQPDTRDAEPICMNDVAEAVAMKTLPRAVQEEGIGALAFIPLNFQGKLLGKFMVYYDSPHVFAESEIQLAQTIANQLGFGLVRKRNEDALRSAGYRLANQARDLERLVKERTAELTRANHQLEDFVYSIAHDLRGPLRSMQAFSELLLDEPALTSEGADFAGRINRSAHLMDKLLTDLLDFSRVNLQQIELVPVHLEAVVQSALAQFDPEIRQKNATIELGGEWPDVHAHEPTLLQVLINLLENGLKFVAPNVSPVLKVRAETRDQLVHVSVEDNGIGIPAEFRRQVFQLFTRLNGAEYPGTGVGLAIVQKGVEHMGGHVGVESAEGGGSMFWFNLPKA